MPIIAMTAHAMKADRQRCLAGGMDGYLSKPIDAHEMIALVESLATGAAAADTGTASRTPLPAEPAKLPTPLLFDPKEALKRCLNKPDLLEQMIAFFFMDVDNLIPQMQAALRKGDLPEVGRLGHRLKGTLGHIAAEPAREAALRVEHFLLHEGQQTEAEKAVRALEEECKILRAALIEHQAASGPMQERR
jgi:CheY-like chemotaxis protein